MLYSTAAVFITSTDQTKTPTMRVYLCTNMRINGAVPASERVVAFACSDPDFLIDNGNTHTLLITTTDRNKREALLRAKALYRRSLPPVPGLVLEWVEVALPQPIRVYA